MKKVELLIFLLIWGGLNYYLGLRGWQSLGTLINGYGIIYWLVMVFLAAAYLIGRWLDLNYPGKVSDALTWIGSYWLGFFFYALLLVVSVDLIRWLDNKYGFLPPIFSDSALTAIMIIILLLLLLIIGTWNAHRPIIRQYQVAISKKAGEVKNLHVMMVSDIHLGNIIGNRRLTKLVKQVNALKPEIIFLVGDIIDGDLRPFEKEDMGQTLQKLESNYGIYAVLGNHEYYGGQYKEIIKTLSSCGITLLRDQCVLIENSFYLLGRDDKYSRKRKPLSVLMAGIDRDLPTIVMDHNPIDIAESYNNKVDLHLSGHTHTGQLSPINLITDKIFDLHWGYMIKDYLHIIVSNGFGTWGPPIRIGNRPEIVEIFINFKN
ncbi:MAG: metallophosphoesterase [Syntrophomonadaceae bacterium]|jgi:predicted MPP superfamily phosphohydrolase